MPRCWWMVATALVAASCTESNPRYVSGTPDARGVTPADTLLPDWAVPYESRPDALPAPAADAGPAIPDQGRPDLASADLPTGDLPWPDMAPLADADPCLGVVCDAPNTYGGTCVGGVCQGYQCLPGWGDCDGDLADGCETDLLGDPVNCGSCGSVCPAVPNGVTTCQVGSCGVVCVAPWQDCNNDPADGCEVPVGVPNSCDRNGLSTFTAAAGATPGCGTPYCGAGGTGSESFGSWHCAFCTHCAKFADGYAWCVPYTGTFSSQRCTKCCKPNDPAYPQICPP